MRMCVWGGGGNGMKVDRYWWDGVFTDLTCSFCGFKNKFHDWAWARLHTYLPEEMSRHLCAACFNLKRTFFLMFILSGAGLAEPFHTRELPSATTDNWWSLCSSTGAAEDCVMVTLQWKEFYLRLFLPDTFDFVLYSVQHLKSALERGTRRRCSYLNLLGI